MNWNENILTRSNGLLKREDTDTAMSCRGPGPARKKRYIRTREEETEDSQLSLVNQWRVELT